MQQLTHDRANDCAECGYANFPTERNSSQQSPRQRWCANNPGGRPCHGAHTQNREEAARRYSMKTVLNDADSENRCGTAESAHNSTSHGESGGNNPNARQTFCV
jgi:hypothetical protein